ncbi:uncharacterized protein LOC143877646 [Tasmannia lanceolata]|uniref:uncharacterized protein LOC143877646 n=1 Tax=Tasmannia lanceolata TaxID=3420 RepID=UPI0040636F28
MWTIRRKSNRVIFSSVFQTHFIPPKIEPKQHINLRNIAGSIPSGNKSLEDPFISSFSNPLFSPLSRFLSTHMVDDDDNDGRTDEDDDNDGNYFEETELGIVDESLIPNVDTILGCLPDFKSDGIEAKRKLEGCNVPVSTELVSEVLARIRNDWAAAYTFFLWAGKQSGYTNSIREYHTMISILGKMRKFDTAWGLIDEMRGGRDGPSLVTPQTLLILIRKYCAVHDVGKAIGTFYTFKRYGFNVGIEEFQDLLCALCRYKNVQDAEHLLFCNESVFPFDTKSFNIILNGWCNMVGNLYQAKRFWNDMGRRGIERDTVSYGSMMSCYSKAGSLRDVLKLFDQMKELDIAPDRKAYNAVCYALAKGKCVKEAIKLVKTMEEKGCAPNVVTYNSLIKPLCKARRIDEARALFDEMLRRGLSPTIRTYHAFFAVVRTAEEVSELLGKMKETRCHPTNDTYIMLIRKFCRWKQHENVFKLWNEMVTNGLSPDRSSYIVLIHGLFLNGKLDEAFKYYEEMKEKGFPPEKKTDEMLEAWVSAKGTARPQIELKQNKDSDPSKRSPSKRSTGSTSNAIRHDRDFLKQPESRSVTRERGFSFW